MTTDFLWGVATSAYQAEGHYNGPNQPRTNWAHAEEKRDVAPLGASSDFLHRYPEDFARCKGLGLNAFRLGLEWSRIQPGSAKLDGNPPPPFDRSALDFYADLICKCRESQLTPVVTLHHFVHPAWLGSDPWLHESTIDWFELYVVKALDHVNTLLTEAGQEPIHRMITINEPNMLVLNSYFGHQFPSGHRRSFAACLQAYDLLMASHVRAYHAIHRLYRERGWREPLVTLNNYCSDLYWSDKFILDILSMRERGQEPDDLNRYIHRKAEEFDAAFVGARIPLRRDVPYYFGDALKRISNWVGYRTFRSARFKHTLTELYNGPSARAFDYIGIDYYDPFTAHAFRLPVWWDHEFRSKSFREWVMNSVTSKWWDWRVLARGMHFFCKYYSEDFGGREILIAENGMAKRRKKDNSRTRRRDGMTRSQFLKLHVHEVVRIVKDGIPVMGYLHWSLFDNYEWGSYTPRFGLYSIDYMNGAERDAVDPDGDNPSATYATLISAARETAHAQEQLKRM
ncbi:MAG TPA: family 1 glycosylhydrolase [Chthoniobacterales bacterium]